MTDIDGAKDDCDHKEILNVEFVRSAANQTVAFSNVNSCSTLTIILETKTLHTIG